MVAVSLKKEARQADIQEAPGGRETRSACFFQAEDGIRDVERSRGLGDVYKRQEINNFSYIFQ